MYRLQGMHLNDLIDAFELGLDLNKIFNAIYSRDHDNNESADSRTSNQSKFLPFSPLSEQGCSVLDSLVY